MRLMWTKALRYCYVCWLACVEECSLKATLESYCSSDRVWFNASSKDCRHCNIWTTLLKEEQHRGSQVKTSASFLFWSSLHVSAVQPDYLMGNISEISHGLEHLCSFPAVLFWVSYIPTWVWSWLWFLLHCLFEVYELMSWVLSSKIKRKKIRVMKSWMMRLWWLLTRTSQPFLLSSRNGSRRRKMRKTGCGKRRSYGGISRLRWERSVWCEDLWLSSMLVEAYVCHELPNTDQLGHSHVSWALGSWDWIVLALYSTWHTTVGISDWGFTGLFENQDCAVKKFTVV